MNRVQEINSHGLARGWHAERLAADAARNGETMAELYRRRIARASAFSVPAECIKATPSTVYYRFSDGSTIDFPNQRG